MQQAGTSDAMVVPVVLCGGNGTRLWPLSRPARPKPFVSLPDGRTPLAHAFERALRIGGAHILAATGAAYADRVSDVFRSIAPAGTELTLLVEPTPRGTAPAIATAARRVAESFGERAIMVVLPSDQLIDEDGFATAVERAVEAATTGGLVVFGVVPTAPSSEFGYIETDGTRVRGFSEKPDPQTAHRFVEGGRHLWNAGIVCMRADTALDAFRRHAPAILAAAEAALAAGRRAGNGAGPKIVLDAEAWSSCAEDSFDYAVLERATELQVVPASFGWTDIGSWPALAGLERADAHGNRVLAGDAEMIDSTGNVVHGNGRPIGLLNVRNLLVVDNGFELLVADRRRLDLLAELSKRLRAGIGGFSDDQVARAGWGHVELVYGDERRVIRNITVNPGETTPAQIHRHRATSWTVTAGEAEIEIDGGRHALSLGGSVSAAVGARCALANPGPAPLELVEIAIGDQSRPDDAGYL